MTQPGDNSGGQSSSSGEESGKRTRKPRLLDVVEYTHTDVILGRKHTDLGVVVRLPAADGETATVRPLASHHVDVDPAELTVLTAADVVES